MLCTDTDNTSGKMVANTKGNTKKTRNTDKELIHTLMVRSTKVIGKRACNTELDALSMQITISVKASGTKANINSGWSDLCYFLS